MNYNSLYNKPTNNHKELIGDIKASDIGGMTEEDMEQLLETDLTPYYTKEQIDDLFSRSFVYREKSGSIVTFDCPSTSQTIPEVTAEIVAVQSGSGDPSPTNVRPIIGWSAVNVYDSDINAWDEEWEVGTYNLQNGEKELYTNYFRSKNFIPIHPNTEYRAVTSNQQIYILFYDMNHNYISYRGGGTFTTPINAYYMNFVITTTNSYNPNVNPISINYPSTDTDYHAYNGTTYTTALKDANNQSLTCYGGSLANVNGVQTLVLTHGYIASYNGETLPSTWISDRDVYAEGTTPTTGAEVVYLLATPTEITQDNLSISSQSGVNNIWADTGDVTVKALDRIIQG